MATAIGQKLEVFASKTEADAKALATSHPGAICFTTDKHSLVFNGVVYSVTEIVNALTDSSTDKALSAAQGKALKALIDALPTTSEMNSAINSAVNTAVGSVYKVKGTKSAISEVLALTDAKVGDVWNVTGEFTLSSKKYPAGTNVVCTTATSTSDHDEGNWDALGGTVDLSPYLTIATAASTYLKKADVVNNLTTTATGKALDAAQGKALNDKIVALNGALIRRGSKNNIAEVIGLTTAKVGDVWNVTSEFTLSSKKYPAETDVVCISNTSSTTHTEANWESLGGILKEDWTGIVKLDGTGTATTIESSTTSTSGGKLYYNTSTKKIYYAVGGKNYTDWNLTGQTNPVLNDRSLACSGLGAPVVNRLYIIGSTLYYFDGTNMVALIANPPSKETYYLNGLGNITVNSTSDNLKSALNGVDAFCKAVEAHKVFVDTNTSVGGPVIISANISGSSTATTVKLSAFIRCNNASNNGISIVGEFTCNRTAGTITNIPRWENTYTEDIYPIYDFPLEAPTNENALLYFGKPSNFEKAYKAGYKFVLAAPTSGINGNAMKQFGEQSNIILVTEKSDAAHNFLLSKISIALNSDQRVITKQTSIQISWDGSTEQWTGFAKLVDDEVLLLTRCVDNLTSDSKYPLTAKQGKALNAQIATKQATLVSGSNIKTVNGQSLLGSGNVDVSLIIQ